MIYWATLVTNSQQTPQPRVESGAGRLLAPHRERCKPAAQRLLLLGHSEADVTAVERALQGLAVTVASCHSVQQALVQLRQGPVSLILADTDQLASLDPLRHSRDRHHSPVVLIAAADRDIDQLLAGWDGAAVDCLFKPLNPVLLAAKVELFLTLEARCRELEAAHSLLDQRQLQQREVEQRLLRLTEHDALTGLANRIKFRDFLAAALHDTDSGGDVALLLIDIDNFKDINDVLGPDVGDSVLTEIASRICTESSAGDLVARLCGDEFAVVLPALQSATGVAVLAARISDCISRSISVAGRDTRVTCSMGISTRADTRGSVEDMLKAASLALKRVKAEGGDNHCFYSEKLEQHNLQRLEIERRLRELVASGHFELHFQPLIDSGDGAIIGAEALIRWPADDAMTLGPDVFIPIAESCGQIKALGEWVLNSAVASLKNWLDSGLVGDSFKLAVNISTLQLMDQQFHSSVKRIIDRCQLPCSYLEFEITESAIMYEPSRVIQNLNKLHGLGITIAIDDFGTGYSSLSYLTRMPVDILKIDKCFIDGIGLITENEAVVRAVVAMAHNLDLALVAEGVEKDTQRRFLIDNHCDYLQGYLFSKPLPEPAFVEYLRQSH